MRLTLLGARVEVKVSRLNKPGQQPTSVKGKLDSIAKTLDPQRVKIEFALVEKEGGALGLGNVQRSSSARDLGEWSFVFTDMPFPQSPQAESGIMEFCNICMKCSNHCLAGAKGTVLSYGKLLEERILGLFDEEKRRDYWDQVGKVAQSVAGVALFPRKRGLFMMRAHLYPM